jgi:glycosyltransferase involved in cell wall biosynthesis
VAPGTQNRQQIGPSSDRPPRAGFNWIVSQIGARQHYGIPRGFVDNGNLRVMYTDAWCRFGHPLLLRGTARMRAFAGRYHPGMPPGKVRAFTTRAIIDRNLHPPRTHSIDEGYKNWLRVGRWYSAAVAKDLARQNLDPACDVFFGFNTACLETFAVLNDRGVPTICDQIDPGEVEEQMVAAEDAKWPGWQKRPGRIPAVYWERMRAEWDAASMILVNSEWSKQALVRQGVPPAKMFIVPVAYQPDPVPPAPARRVDDGIFNVLWIGAVNLRKGIPYLVEAAKLLQSNPRIRFTVAGPILISEMALKSAPPNMEFIGRVTRDQTGRMYRDADVFVLPTVSDGFAITQVEAMAQGLPVITTPNCGRVVTHGVDGLVVPACDPVALADAIGSLEADRPRVRGMSAKALDKSRQFRLSRQAELMEAAVHNYRAGRRWDLAQP